MLNFSPKIRLGMLISVMLIKKNVIEKAFNLLVVIYYVAR